MTRFFLLLTLVILSQPLRAQFTLNTPTEVTLFGAGGALFSAGQFLFNDFPPLSEEEVKAFYTTPKTFTFGFDRWATRQSSKIAKTVSDALLFSSIAPPLILAFDRPTAQDDRKTYSLMLAQTFVLNLGATTLAKRAARRPRPYMYNDNLVRFPMELRRSNNGRISFFSGHTSVTSAMYFYTARTFSEYYPDSSGKPWVWGTSIAIPAITGFLRVKAGKHFPTDVIVGYAIGALIGGVLVPALHL